jgi:hypothetical protein
VSCGFSTHSRSSAQKVNQAATSLAYKTARRAAKPNLAMAGLGTVAALFVSAIQLIRN